eukprot:scaffold10.g2243.t1
MLLAAPLGPRLAHPRAVFLTARCRPTRRAIAGWGSSAAGAVAGEPPAHRDERLLQPDPEYIPPARLPPPPASAALVHVLPYLAKVALGEPALYWRLGAALLLLLAAKTAGLLAPILFKRAVDALLPCFTPVAQAAGRRLSFYAFLHVLGLDLQFHLGRRTGALSRMLERGTRSVAMIFRAVVFTFLPTAVELAAVCAVLARSFHPRVSLLVLATFAAYAAWTVALTWTATGLRRRVKELDNRISGKAVDALLNFETIKASEGARGEWRRGWGASERGAASDEGWFPAVAGALCPARGPVASPPRMHARPPPAQLFANEGLEVREYDVSLANYQAASVRMEVASAALNAGQAVVLAAGMTAVLLAAAGSGSAAGGAISPGDLVMIQGLLLQLWAPLQFLGWFYRELRQSLVDMEDLFQLLSTQSALLEGTADLLAPGDAAGASVREQEGARWEELRASHAAASTSGSNGSGAGRSRGLRVEMRDVVFRYRGSDGSSAGRSSSASAGGDQGSRQVLSGVSIVAEPGESIAVVGPSGSGKSTLLRLLVRLYDADGGAVLLDGLDVRQLRQESLRSAVAVVPQDVPLFNDTILSNVAFGRPGCTFEEAQAAAAAAQLDAAIARMPAGWDTLVGERGLKLSGGEKQRVAIARAFLRQPRLLICDEATSALDTSTERGIMASLGRLAAGCTAVFGCDRIYVLAEGKVAEQGMHEQLMAARGIYYDMWQLQAAEQTLEEHLPHRKDAAACNGNGNARQQLAAALPAAGDLRGDNTSEDEGEVVGSRVA